MTAPRPVAWMIWAASSSSTRSHPRPPVGAPGRGGSPGPRGVPCPPPAGGPVHYREQLGAGDPELHHHVPASAQVLHRVLRVGVELRALALQELRVAVLGDSLEEPLLVSEEAVDRRRLRSGRGGDRAGAHRVWAAVLQQLDGCLDDAATRTVGGVVRGHESMISKTWFH